MDFGPQVIIIIIIGIFLLYEDFWKMIIFWGFCWNLRLVYKLIISWRILVSFRGFFSFLGGKIKVYFCYGEIYIWVSIILSSFASLLYFFFNVNGKATVWVTHPPLFNFDFEKIGCLVAILFLFLFLNCEFDNLWHPFFVGKNTSKTEKDNFPSLFSFFFLFFFFFWAK